MGTEIERVLGGKKYTYSCNLFKNINYFIINIPGGGSQETGRARGERRRAGENLLQSPARGGGQDEET